MFDVTALGEILIDFTPAGTGESGNALFEQNPGGAPANVLTALARLGQKTAFIGKVGDDMHGRLLASVLRDNGICTDGLIIDPDTFTTLAFVTLVNGERDFSFARKPGADTRLTPEEVRADIVRQSRIFHFGSLSLTDQPARDATHFAVRQAKEAGAIISYDPNYRAPLWSSKEAAVEQMRSVIPYVDIMKISDEECALLTDYKKPEKAAAELIRQGVSCVVVTLGGDGALLATADFTVREKGAARHVVDTTGAGDAFWGGMLSRLAYYDQRPDQLTPELAKECLRFANAVAGLCVEKRGAIPAMPYLEDVLAELI